MEGMGLSQGQKKRLYGEQAQQGRTDRSLGENPKSIKFMSSNRSWMTVPCAANRTR